MNKSEHIRRARSEDRAAILALYRSLVGTEGCTWNEEYPSLYEIEDDLAHDSLYCVQNANGAILGAAFAGKSEELDGLDWLEGIKKPCDLARIGVAPDFHRCGIATRLLSFLLEDAAARGFDGMRLLVSKTNPAAITLYRKAGFEFLGDARMYGINFYRCEKKL